MIFVIIFLLMFGFWIYAEQKRIHVLARVGGGLACMVLLCLATSFVSQIIPSYEHNFHKTVIRALHTYNGIAATGSTYQAAMLMGHVLYESYKH